MTTFTESTEADFDSLQAETGVHHEQPTDTSFAPADEIQRGYPTTSEFTGLTLDHYYPLQDASAPVTDHAGAFDLSAAGDPTLGATPGPNGFDYADLDGNNDEFIYSDFVNIPTDFTLSFLYKPGTDLGTTSLALFGSGSGFIVYVDATFEELRAGSNRGVSTIVDASTSVSVGTWYHGGFTWEESTDTATLYHNGTQESQETDWDVGSLIWRSVGGNYTGNQFHGGVAEYRLYTGVATPAQMSELADTALGQCEYWADKKVS